MKSMGESLKDKNIIVNIRSSPWQEWFDANQDLGIKATVFLAWDLHPPD